MTKLREKAKVDHLKNFQSLETAAQQQMHPVKNSNKLIP